jgi:tyramine---L-glutamate ligase
MRVLFGEYLSGLADEPVDQALLAQGAGMRDAVLADLLACAAADPALQLSCAVSPQAPLPPGMGALRRLQRQAGESALDLVRREALRHDAVWLVAPETDDLLGRLCDVVPPARWLGCDSASIRLASSKLGTTTWLHTVNVLTPHGFEGDPAVRGWVVKPDDGVGASGARRHASRTSAEADLAQRHGRAVIEPWIEGPAMSLTLLCERGRAELWSVNRQRIDVDDNGWLVERGVEPLDIAAEAALQGLAQQVAQALPGLFGPVGIDYVAHPTRGPVLIEVNPRVTSVYAGLVQPGRRSPARATLDLFQASRHGSGSAGPLVGGPLGG